MSRFLTERACLVQISLVGGQDPDCILVCKYKVEVVVSEQNTQFIRPHALQSHLQILITYILACYWLLVPIIYSESFML